MATRTISNAGGNWSSTAAWVEGVVPTSADDVVATASSGNLTHDNGTQACRSIDFTNYTGTFTFASGQGPLIVGDASGGDVKLVAGMTVSYLAGGGGWNMVATTGGIVKFTSAGKSVGELTCAVGATTTLQLQDDIVSTVTTGPRQTFLASGKFDTQGFDITTAGIGATSTGPGLVTLGDSVITISNTAASSALFINTAGTTFAANTATFVLTGASPTINPSNLNWNGATVKFTGGGTVTTNGGGTSGLSVTVDSTTATTLKFPAGTNSWTIPTLTMIGGSAGTHHALITGTAGTTSPIVVTSSASVPYTDFKDIIVTGAAAPLDARTGGVNNGNNQGVKFSTPYVVQSVKKGQASTTAVVQALPMDTQAGSTIIVLAGGLTHPVASNGVTDSLGNTYTKIDGTAGAPFGEVWVTYNVATGGANTVTVTLTGSDGGAALVVHEIGGVAAAPLDKMTKATGNSTAPNSGASAVTTTNDELVYGWVCSASTSGSPAAGAGYGNLQFAAPASGIQVGAEAKVVAGTAAQTATFTIASAAWTCGVITFVSSAPSTGISYVKEIGQGTQAGSGTSWNVTTSAAAGAGNLIVGRISVSNAQTLSSVTDSRGNTWQIDVQTTAGPCAAIVSTVQDVAPLQSGDTITITLAGSVSQGNAIFDEFSGVLATSARVDKTATGSASTTSRDAGTTALTTQAAELVVGCFVVGSTESALTPGVTYSDFTTKYLNNVGTAIEGEYKIVNALGTQNPTATGGTSLSTKGCVATYKAAAPLDRYSVAVLAQNPDHFLRLQETSGTNADDATTNNRDGTFGGTYTLGAASVVLGNSSAVSVDFNDTGYIQVVGYVPYGPGISNTFMGWAVRDSSTDYDVFWAAAFGGAANNGPMLMADAGFPNVRFWNDVQDAARQWVGVLPANGTPFHWAMTYNDTTRQAELFINGVKQTSDTPFDPGQNYEAGQGSLYWAAWGSGTARLWDGRMSHVAVWSSILSDATILSLYQAGAATVPVSIAAMSAVGF